MTLTADHDVGPEATVEHVVATVAVKGVVAGSAGQHVVAVAAIDGHVGENYGRVHRGSSGQPAAVCQTNGEACRSRLAPVMGEADMPRFELCLRETRGVDPVDEDMTMVRRRHRIVKRRAGTVRICLVEIGGRQ